MRVLCVLGKHQYGRPALGAGTEYVAFTSALRRLGHDVSHFESWNRSAHRSPAELNSALFETVRRDAPDVLLSVQRDCEIWMETIDAINAQGTTATVSWTTDDSWKYREVSRFIGRHYHAITTTYASAVPSYRRDGIRNVLLTQWAANADWLQQPLPAVGCRYGVSFVGAAYETRRALIAGLHKRGIAVECFGNGWPSGAVSAEDLPRIFRESLLSLNFVEGFKNRSHPQIKARTFEVPGAGGLLLTEYAPGIEDWYKPGEEMLVHSGLDDLARQVRRIHDHPEERDAIARAGFLRTSREHTYERRLAEVLDFALEAKRAGSRFRSGPCLRAAMGRCRVGWPLMWFRGILVWLCALVWGEDRGRRAARRFVFEISWRVFGERTFASRGLPGRLFPEV